MGLSDFRPPFVTEADEPVWNDCLICAGLMAVCAWTLNGVVTKQDGSLMSKSEMKVLRERLRHLSGDHTGGTSLGELARAIEAMWPSLPPIERPIGDTGGTRLTWSQFLYRLANGWVATLNGNPSEVKDPKSPLRRWTVDDDFGHAIYVGPYSAFNRKVWVMDPLGRGDYEGQWVDLEDVFQYAWFTPDNRVYAAVFEVGAQGGDSLLRSVEGLVRQSNKLFAMKQGTRIFRSPNGRKLVDLAKDSAPEVYGVPDAEYWLAVEVGFNGEPVIGYVPSDAGELIDKPVEQTEPQPEDVSALIEQVADLNQRVENLLAENKKLRDRLDVRGRAITSLRKTITSLRKLIAKLRAR